MFVSRNLLRFAAVLAFGLTFAGCVEAPAPLEPSGEDRSLLGGTLRIVSRLLPLFDTTSEATIGPEGGTLSIAGGHSLHFPAGALDDSVTISAVTDALKIMVDLGPEGLVFPDSAQPTLVGFPLVGRRGTRRRAHRTLRGGPQTGPRAPKAE